jgi:hypothetical protein
MKGLSKVMILHARLEPLNTITDLSKCLLLHRVPPLGCQLQEVDDVGYIHLAKPPLQELIDPSAHERFLVKDPDHLLVQTSIGTSREESIEGDAVVRDPSDFTPLPHFCLSAEVGVWRSRVVFPTIESDALSAMRFPSAHLLGLPHQARSCDEELEKEILCSGNGEAHLF